MNNFLSYLLQSTLCLSLFWLMFRMVMRREHFFGLTRMLLLTIVLLSAAIPFIPLPFPSQSPVRMEMLPAFSLVERSAELNAPAKSILTEVASTEIQPAISNVGSKAGPSIPQLLFYGYLIGCFIAVLALLRGLVSVLLLTREATSIPIESFRILVVERDIPAFSFGRWVVLSQTDYEQHRLPLLAHEQAHIRLYHFFDLVLLETARIFHWFNPTIYWLIRDLKEIHEFQADDYTLTHGIDATQYQLLIIQKGVGARRFALANSFNHCPIKKRITMMNQSKTNKAGSWKVATFLPLLAVLLMAFGRQGENVIDFQENQNPIGQRKDNIGSVRNGITNEQLLEYELIVKKSLDGRGIPDFRKISEVEKKRLKELFLLMNTEQRAVQLVVFIPAPPPLPKVVPTIEQMKSWEDPKVYGLWINGKRVANSDLKKYKRTDFAGVFVGKLEKNALNYGKHYYQVILMTNEYYANYLIRGELAEEFGIAIRKQKVAVKLKSANDNDGNSNQEAFDSTKTKLFVVDGVITDQRRAKYFMKVGVESVTILDGKDATDKYREKAKNGVCEITLKKGEIKERSNNSKEHIELVYADKFVQDNRNPSIEYFYHAQVKLNEGMLNADYIELNKDSSLIFATGRPDSTGTIIGKPVLVLGSQKITANEIRYNYKTKNYKTSKGIIYNIGESKEF